jgi:hypothetical protein
MSKVIFPLCSSSSRICECYKKKEVFTIGAAGMSMFGGEITGAGTLYEELH